MDLKMHLVSLAHVSMLSLLIMLTMKRYYLNFVAIRTCTGGMHLAHMLLVLGILPSLTNGSSDDNPSRGIMVSSEMASNTAIGVFSPHDPHLTELFSKSNLRGEITRGTGKLPESLPAYGRAKLLNILFALELNRRQ